MQTEKTINLKKSEAALGQGQRNIYILPTYKLVYLTVAVNYSIDVMSIFHTIIMLLGSIRCRAVVLRDHMKRTGKKGNIKY